MEELECYSCDAVFSVEHDMDEDYYGIKYCPFCGTTIATDEVLDWGDYEEE